MAPAADLQAESAMASKRRSTRIIRDGKERKDRVVHVRFSASEIAIIQAAAEAAALTVSSFMRSLTIEGAGVRPFFSPDDVHILTVLRMEIRALGINLNHLARSANHGRIVVDDELAATLVEVQRLVAALLLELRHFSRDAVHRRHRVV